jgi:hypothetical protein
VVVDHARNVDSAAMAAMIPVLLDSVTGIYLHPTNLSCIDRVIFCKVHIGTLPGVNHGGLDADRLRLIGLVYPFAYSVWYYRRRFFEMPSRSRNRRETITTMPTNNGGIGGMKTASHL